DAQLNIEVAEPVAEAVIAWNFTSDWPATTIQGETADGTDLWTDSVDEANSPGGTKVANSTDDWAVTTPVSASQVTVAWSSSGMWSAGAEGNADQGLYRVYLDDGGSGPTVTVSGLDDWLDAQGSNNAYTVDFYRCTDSSDNTFAELNIYEGTNTAGTLLESLPAELAAGDGAYPTGTGAGGSRLKQSATSSFSAATVTFHTDHSLGGGNRAGLAGFKITAFVDTTPADPVEDLVIAGPVAGGMELSWTGEDGKPYGVETNSNLIIGDWQSYTTGVMGAGATITITNTIDSDQTFYRVISE
ncbi:MAG: hypothetical protein KAU94_00080, partial [Verrucomicrobia bacterium]|nr:hypothetical protein [Verrucomicrobiota bacterium]